MPQLAIGRGLLCSGLAVNGIIIPLRLDLLRCKNPADVASVFSNDAGQFEYLGGNLVPDG
jgi:hypothetical protein